MPEIGELAIGENFRSQLLGGEHVEPGNGQVTTSAEAIGGTVAEFGSLLAGQKETTNYTRPYDYTPHR